jgi:hypothetical protein
MSGGECGWGGTSVKPSRRDRSELDVCRRENAAANSSWGPWKSESAKECITTHLPNELALKMDGAQACNQSPLNKAINRPFVLRTFH